jgi:pyruvate dehydrogenase E1 component alpha subunit
MPRTAIHPKHAADYLSILDEDGQLDEKLEPSIPEEVLRRMLRSMMLCRAFDARMLSLQRQGRLGTFGPTEGQEASQIGAVATLGDEDWLVPSYRETCMALWRGTPMAGILLYNAGYNEGGRIPDDQNDLPISIPVGTQMLHAVGIGYALSRNDDQNDDRRVVLTCFGDGATSQGDFHEALNFAAVFRTPVVFLCQNNQWAISLPRDKQTRARTIAQKALAYGMNGVQVDGNDILAVYAAVGEAIDRARTKREPTLVECVTYRLSVHTTADDPTKYRSKEEVAAWQKRDPIPRFRTYLTAKGVLAEDEIDRWDGEIEDEIDAAWEDAQRQMGRFDDPLHIFEHVYASMPRYLAEQRAGLEAMLRAKREGKHS